MKRYYRWQPEINRAGFSLIELSIVIALFSIIALFSGSHILFFNRITVRSELEQLYTICYMLQRTAMMLQQPQTLQFDVQHGRYRFKKTEHCLPAHVQFGAALGVKGPPSAPDKTIENPITFQNSTITFFSDGTIQSGAVYLTDRSGRYTYALSCAVSQISYLRKYQYTNKWVIL